MLPLDPLVKSSPIARLLKGAPAAEVHAELSKLDASDLTEDARAAQAFLAWNRAGGRILPGLMRRREAEKRLFLSQGATTPGKWAVAGAGGTLGGTLAAGLAESFAGSFGFGLSSLLDWRGLLVTGGLIGLASMAMLWAIGEERRERLWDRLFS